MIVNYTYTYTYSIITQLMFLAYCCFEITEPSLFVHDMLSLDTIYILIVVQPIVHDPTTTVLSFTALSPHSYLFSFLQIVVDT